MKDYKAFTVSSTGGRFRELMSAVKVSISAEIAGIFKIPISFVDVMALWDTGATSTSISKRLAARLQLPPLSRQKIICAGQPYESCIYKIDLLLPNMVGFRGVMVTEFEDSNKFDVLVGMDIITMGDFSVTNAEERTVWSFRLPPSDKHIDFVEEHEHSKATQTAIKQYKRQLKHHRK
jgi:hypothetical protein